MSNHSYIIVTLLVALLVLILGAYGILTSIYQGWLSSFPDVAPERVASLQFSSTLYFFSGLLLLIGSPLLSFYLIRKKLKRVN